MKQKTILELKNISYSYDEKTNVLDNISLSIHEKEQIAVLGNNGAGKSTLFLCCNGVLSPNQGERYLEGQLITNQKKSKLSLHQAVGLVFQEPDDQMIAGTVETELSFGPCNLGLTQEEVKRRVDDVMIAMNLEKYRTRPPHYLSGGEKKQVTIADILTMHPQIILFDEPTASLDAKSTERLENILNELNEQNITMLISTHDINFVYRWAKRILVLNEGQLLADDSPENIFGNEQLLQKVGLGKPMLYELTEIFCEKYQKEFPLVAPKTIEEFKALFL